jgi:cytochrome c-type biogenesis protein
MGDEPIQIGYFLAFAAGIFSFASPSILQLMPGYVSLITGFSFQNIRREHDRISKGMVTAGNALLFILGFSSIFIMLGLSVTGLGTMVAQYEDYIRQTGGVVVFLLGLVVAGALPQRFQLMEKKVNLQSRPAGLAGSFLVGTTFGVSWTPGVGPILASILIFIGIKDNLFQGFLLLFYYTLGLSLPFFFSAMFIEKFIAAFRDASRWMRYVQPVSGLCLALMGVLIFFDLLEWLVPATGGLKK